jgi:hypothetical protein
LLFGGIAYTLGAIVLMLNWPILIPGVVGAHELWHFAVLVGLGLHWAFIFQFAGGLPPARPKLSSADGNYQESSADEREARFARDYSDAYSR